MHHTPDINRDVLEENLFALVEQHPLDDLFNALESALRRRAVDINSTLDKNIFLDAAAELRDIVQRDYYPLDPGATGEESIN